MRRGHEGLIYGSTKDLFSMRISLHRNSWFSIILSSHENTICNATLIIVINWLNEMLILVFLLMDNGLPVLIITGDNDKIVPSWNAKGLSKAIPGSCLEVIKNCGHLPHEEKVEEFVSIVYKFLHGAFGDQKELSLQAGAVV